MNIPTLEQINSELSKRDLHFFVKELWKYVDPATFIDNWHIQAICEHLQEVKKGNIKKLIINIPPRHCKSLLTSVFFPAWLWLDNPEKSFLFASYAHSLSIRDSVKTRRVIQSKKYQNILKYVNPDFRLVGDQNTKIKFENNFRGYRLATSVDGALTGDGGDIIVIDDPHNVKQSESEQIRNNTLQWWNEAMSTRLNDPKTGAYIIIMQRVHEKDLTGHILAKEHDWNHICLPLLYEGENKCKTVLNFKDKRKKENDILWKKRYNKKIIKDLYSKLGVYAFAGQMQQRPAPRAGGMFKRENFRIINNINDFEILKKVRFWDKAGTQDGGCYTAGVLMYLMKDYKFVIADVVRGQWDYAKREQIIKATAERDGKTVKIWIEQEPGSGGKESAQNTIKNLKGYVCKAERPTGDKITRAEPLSAQVEINNVYLLNRFWVDDFLDEITMFPNSEYKDQLDATAGAFNKLNNLKNSAGTW